MFIVYEDLDQSFDEGPSIMLRCNFDYIPSEPIKVTHFEYGWLKERGIMLERK